MAEIWYTNERKLQADLYNNYRNYRRLKICTKLERQRDGINSRGTRGCHYNDDIAMDHKCQNTASIPSAPLSPKQDGLCRQMGLGTRLVQRLLPKFQLPMLRQMLGKSCNILMLSLNQYSAKNSDNAYHSTPLHTLTSTVTLQHSAHRQKCRYKLIYLSLICNCYINTSHEERCT